MELPRRGYFFDWDGVLADSLPLMWHGVYRTAVDFGGKPPSFTKCIQAYDGLDYQTMYSSFGCDTSDMDALVCTYKTHVHESYHMVPMFYEAIHMLDFLTRIEKFTVGIISAEESSRILPKLQSHGLSLDFVIGDATDKTEAILEQARAHDLNPNEVTFYDDIAKGVLDGKRAGVGTVGWQGKHPEKREQLEKAGAGHIETCHGNVEEHVVRWLRF